MKRRVLVIAFAIDPARGSEAGVGWGWTRMIAGSHDVTLMTAAFNRAGVDSGLVGAPEMAGVQICYVPARWWHFSPGGIWRFIENSPLKPIMNLAYSLWQRDAYELGQKLCAQTRFDLVHLVTYVGFRFPGKFDRLGPPFVWGPVGGLENTPWRFLPMFGASGCAYYAVRNIINSLQKRYLPGPKRAFQKAGACGGIIAATAGIQREIRKWYGQDSQVICEIGPPPESATDYSRREPGQALSIAWSALHLGNKALPLLLRSLATLPSDANWELKILGQGPCTRQWKKLADKLGIAGRCRWLGWLPRDQALEEMHSAHLFVITSMKDLTSTVLVEALSQGLPVVCPDHCGFSDIVTDQCGIKLPMHSPKQLEADLAAAVHQLCFDESGRRELAAGALRRVRDVSWEGKSEVLNAIYASAARS